jgi:hypothetical protein
VAPFTFMAILVIGTTIWATFDARANQVSTSGSQPYSFNTGALAWFVGCLLLWIVVFPCYLVRRSHTLQERATPRQVAATPPAIAASQTSGPIGSAAVMYCQDCGQQLPRPSVFCSRCGKPTGADAPPPEAPNSSPTEE